MYLANTQQKHLVLIKKTYTFLIRYFNNASAHSRHISLATQMPPNIFHLFILILAVGVKIFIKI